MPGSAGVAGAKVVSLVAGMVAGADSIDEMDMLRHGGMAGCSSGCARRRRWARSCAGSASAMSVSWTRSPPGSWSTWPGRCPLLPGGEPVAYLDVDDTVRAIYGYAKQGAGYGYTGVKGLNALLAILSTAGRGAGDRRLPAAQGRRELGPRRGPAGRRRV